MEPGLERLVSGLERTDPVPDFWPERTVSGPERMEPGLERLVSGLERTDPGPEITFESDDNAISNPFDRVKEGATPFTPLKNAGENIFCN